MTQHPPRAIAPLVEAEKVDPKRMDFRAILREERTSRGLSQAALAVQAGVSPHAVWEAEQGNGTVAVLAALAKALDLRFVGLAKGASWGQRIRAQRVKRGWSQQKLADRAGVSPMAISRLENGNARMATLSAALAVLAPQARVRMPQIANWGDGSRDERFTPRAVVDRIESVLGGIDLDPCAHRESPVRAARYIHREEDGLATPWNAKTVYVNPPYSQTGEFIRKAAHEWRQGRAEMVLLLVPVKTHFAWFHEEVFGVADIFLLRGRIAFERPGFPNALAPFSLMLILYGAERDTIERVLGTFECGHIPRDVQRSGRAAQRLRHDAA